jgi:hypothetical protein
VKWQLLNRLSLMQRVNGQVMTPLTLCKRDKEVVCIPGWREHTVGSWREASAGQGSSVHGCVRLFDAAVK